MKVLIFLLLSLLTSCTQKQPVQGGFPAKNPPELFMSATDTALRNNNGTWFYKKQKANGYILEKRGNTLVAKLPIIDGKENGTAYGWYESGEKRYERNFKNGNRDGTHTIWYRNGQLAGVNQYIDDKLDGEQKTYFSSGNRWQSLKYENGYEEGKQKTWSDSGRVVNNFTVKNGKLYGVIGRYDCMSVMQK